MNSSASFPANHGFLASRAPAITVDLTLFVDHPVTGDQVGYRIPGDSPTDGVASYETLLLQLIDDGKCFFHSKVAKGFTDSGC